MGKTIRKNLTGRPPRKEIDMELVYRQLDSGRKVADVAEEWGVCRSTLYRRHKIYQAQISKGSEDEPELPKLPEDF